jgi:hypothetical protein
VRLRQGPGNSGRSQETPAGAEKVRPDGGRIPTSSKGSKCASPTRHARLAACREVIRKLGGSGVGCVGSMSCSWLSRENLSSLDLSGTGDLAKATWRRGILATGSLEKDRYKLGLGESMENRRSGVTSLSVAPRYKELER